MLILSIFQRKSRADGPALRYAGYEDKGDVKAGCARCSGRAVTPPRQPQLGPDDGALAQNLAPEPDEFRRPAAGLGEDLAGFLDQPLLVDEAAEILLVQPPPGKRLDGALERNSVKLAGISSNTTGRYLILARSRAMPVARMRRWSCASARRRSDPRRVASAGRDRVGAPQSAPLRKELVAFQHPLLVPRRGPRGAKGEPKPFRGSRRSASPAPAAPSGRGAPPTAPSRRVCRAANPPRENIGTSSAKLPRRRRLAAPRHECQIGDGQGAPWLRRVGFDAVAVAKGVSCST